MKLRQRPHKSSVGVKFKISDEYSLPFHIFSVVLNLVINFLRKIIMGKFSVLSKK